MKFLIPIIIALSIVNNSLARPEGEPIDNLTAEVIKKHFLEQGKLMENEDFERIGKLFKDTKIYTVWLNNVGGTEGSTGAPITLLKQGDKMTIFTFASDAAVMLIKSYDGNITNKNELRDLMSYITPITTVEEKGKGVYHVYNGKDFFDFYSGYLVTVKNGKVQSCESKLKLGKKKE